VALVSSVRSAFSALQRHGGVGTTRAAGFGLFGAGFRMAASKEGFTGTTFMPHATRGAAAAGVSDGLNRFENGFDGFDRGGAGGAV
jgi:hypothetical protein